MELNVNSDGNLTQNNVKTLKFPYKLWIITNSQGNHAIKWNHEDKKILINTTLLGTYLCSNETIFKVKNISEFIKKLSSFGFVRCDNQNLEAIVSNLFEENFPRDENSLYEIYKHDNFQKNHFELLKNIDKIDKLEKDYDDILPIIREINQYKRRKLFPSQQSNDNNINKHITDPCCSNKIDKLSNIEKPRLCLRTLIQVELNQYILNQRVYECDQNTSLVQNESAVIQLPAEVFENASESVSGFVEKTDYAGFYGSNMNFEKIRDFFAEYLPVYVHSNGEDEIINGNRVDDNGDVDGFRSTSLDFENSGTSYPENLEDTEYINTLNYSTVPLYPKATSLEPIYATEENDDEEMPNNSDPNNEEDITMDEYLKFNKNETNNTEEQQISNQDSKENITNNIKIEDEKVEKNINDDESNQKNNNEESFKIFFNQYRDSMNVLYET